MRVPRLLLTNNFSKAMVLASLGIPMVDISGKKAGHGDCPEFRTITDKDLEKHGFKSVEDAERHNFEGNITYAFGEHPERKAISKAFETAHCSLDASADIPDTMEVKDAKTGKAVTVRTVELMAAFGAVLFRNRKKFADRRKKVRAKLHYTKPDGLPSLLDRRSSEAVKERMSK